MFIRWFFGALRSFQASHPTAGEWDRAWEVIDRLTEGEVVDDDEGEEMDSVEDEPLTVDDIPLVCRQYIRYDDNGLPIPESEEAPRYRVYIVVARDPDIERPEEEEPVSVSRLAERGGVVVGQARRRAGTPAVALRKFHNAAAFQTGNEHRMLRNEGDFHLVPGEVERFVPSGDGIRRFDSVTTPGHPGIAAGYLTRDVYGAVTGYRGHAQEMFTQSFWDQVTRDLGRQEAQDPQDEAARILRERAGEIRGRAERPYRLTAEYAAGEAPALVVDGTIPASPDQHTPSPSPSPTRRNPYWGGGAS